MKHAERRWEPLKILITADDITGTLDTGAQFARRGIPTEVLELPITAEQLQSCTADVAVINTETRHVSVQQAYDILYDICHKAVQAGVPILYKKTDSALRGHLGAELEAASKALGGETALFFPAYPEMGRTTRDGCQYIYGVPLAQSAFAKDDLNPMHSSRVADILHVETALPVEEISGTDCSLPQGGIAVVDAVTEEELDAAAARYIRPQPGKTVLIAGCAGLAKAVSRQMRGGREAVGPEMKEKLFILCGTGNAVTQAQVQCAQRQGFTRISFGIGELIADCKSDSCTEKLERVQQALRDGLDLIVDIAKTDASFGHIPDLSSRIVAGLSAIAVSCGELLEDYTLFMTGGDTLSAYMRCSGCRKVAIIGEILPGMPVNRFTFGESSRYVISKSGGYGSEDVISICKQKLTEQRKR